MYSALKAAILAVLKVPPEPLDPMGDVNTLKVFRASPNFYWYKLATWLVKNCVGLLILFATELPLAAYGLFMTKNTAAMLAAAVAVLVILVGFLAYVLFSFLIIRLDYELRWYKVTDRSLRIREGVLNVREMTMSFDNIQNISISQGPLQRFLQIADLKVETAGGGSAVGANTASHESGFKMHVGYFTGIDNFEEIRDLMIGRLRRIKDAGLGDNSPAERPARDDRRGSKLRTDMQLHLKELLGETALFRKTLEALSAGK